jgi:hypothetical protein
MTWSLVKHRDTFTLMSRSDQESNLDITNVCIDEAIHRKSKDVFLRNIMPGVYVNTCTHNNKNILPPLHVLLDYE